MLEVARILGRSPPPDTQLIFIASGGEEQGLVGMRKIAKEKMLPAGAKVLNLDGVGFGHQPFVIEGNGILRKTKTSEDLNRLLEKSIERSKLKPARWWVPIARHDHIPLLKAGFDATTLTFDELGDEGGWLARAFRLRNARRRRYPQLHTKDDLPECLSLETVERAGEIALDFLKEA
jgi:Zn-dependent M28 family amino/carboxypeptidase